MAPNTVNFKVFLRDGSETDVRRFTIDDDSVVTSFIFMKEKLQHIFPLLRDCTFKITWKDSDGDEITIVSDEDLITAFTEMSGNLKILYITTLDKHEVPMVEDEIGVAIPRAYCDGCQQIITGFRYKCMQCPDFDLCSICESKGLHPEHVMMRSSQPELFFPRTARRLASHVHRSLRKAHYFANKEACRAAKFMAKEANKYCTKNEKNEKKEKTESKPETSTTCGEQRAADGCPFSEINSNFIAPLLDTFLNPQNPAARAHIDNIIRNVVSNFFGGRTSTNQQNETAPSEGDSQNQKESQEPKNKETENNKSKEEESNASNQFVSPASSVHSSETTTRLYPQVPEHVINEATSQYIQLMRQQNNSNSALMEVEVNNGKASAPVIDLMSENKPNEPGWTFVNESKDPKSTVDPNNLKIADGLKQLIEMGFSNELNLVALLKRFDGNVGEVVKYLFENNI